MSVPTPEASHRRWQAILAQLDQEVAALSPAEQGWLRPRLQASAELRARLHRLFGSASGTEICRDCGGRCCQRGRHHVTLVDLLGFLLSGRTPPLPDFTASCPFLAERGCRLAPADRPFNCVTFICEAVEQRMSGRARECFYRLERELRTRYREFDLRYAGSSLRGILIRADTLRGRPFLDRPGRIARHSPARP